MLAMVGFCAAITFLNFAYFFYLPALAGRCANRCAIRAFQKNGYPKNTSSPPSPVSSTVALPNLLVQLVAGGRKRPRIVRALVRVSNTVISQYQQNGTDPQAAWQFRDAASLGARRRNIASSSQHTLPFGALVVQAFALLVLDNLLHLVEGLLELPGARRLSRQVRPEFGGFLGQRVSLLADLRVLR